MNKKSIILISSLSTLFVVGMTVVVSKGIDSNNSLLGRASNDVTETLTFNRSTAVYNKISTYVYSFGKTSTSGNNFYLYSDNWYNLSSSDYSNHIVGFYNLSGNSYFTFSKSASAVEACRFQTINTISIRTTGAVAKVLIYTESTDGINFTDASPEEVEVNYLGKAFALSNSEAHYVKVAPKANAEVHIDQVSIKYTCAQ